jgi:hypothetical protein
MKKLIPALLILMIFSCKKDPFTGSETQELQLTGTYNYDLFAKLDPVQMITKTSKTTDAAIIKSYIARNRVTGFTFDQTDDGIAMELPQFRFTSAVDASITWINNSKTPVKEAKVKTRTANDLVIEYIMPDTSNNTYKSTISVVNLSKYPFVSQYVPQGIAFMYIWKVNLQLEIINKELYMPLLNYHIQHKGEGAYNGWGVNQLYILDPNIQSSLGDNDTLIVQTKHLRMIKK